LPPKVKALIWLITARELDCNYIWQSSVNAARAAGIGAELIASIESGRAPPGLAAGDTLLFDFCYQLLRDNHHVSDTVYQAVIAEFGTAATVQIAATVGYIVMLGVVANAFDIAPPPDDSQPAL
jgi:alkylhydroperoxidase family enzyme